MKYTYAYKTPDGARHEATADAESREAVFEALRRRGIRAIKVVAADGSKANGEIRGVRRRVAAAVAVAAAAAAAAVAFLAGGLNSQPAAARGPQAVPRHQIYGDPALMEELYESGFSGVFDDALDRYMAYFAQPGLAADESQLAKLRPHVLAGGAKGRPDVSAAAAPAEEERPREIRELVEIVLGMREEMREFLAGGASMVEYLDALSERQREEGDIYSRVAAELEGERDESVREARNAALRTLGLRTVPRPRPPRR